MDSSPFWRQ